MEIKNLDILKHLNILLVEDDIKVQDDMKILLSMYFKKVYVAGSVKSALEMIECKMIHMYIIDIYLPDGNGISLISEIRKKNINIPIVVLTNYMNIEFLHSVVPLNVTNYILKPINLKILKDTLFDCIKRLEAKYFRLSICDEITYNFMEKYITYQNQPIFLGANEFNLLELFLANINKIVTKADIESAIYNRKEMSEPAYKNLLFRFKKKLPFLNIITIKNNGYILKVDDIYDF